MNFSQFKSSIIKEENNPTFDENSSQDRLTEFEQQLPNLFQMKKQIQQKLNCQPDSLKELKKELEIFIQHSSRKYDYHKILTNPQNINSSKHPEKNSKQSIFQGIDKYFQKITQSNSSNINQVNEQNSIGQNILSDSQKKEKLSSEEQQFQVLVAASISGLDKLVDLLQYPILLVKPYIAKLMKDPEVYKDFINEEDPFFQILQLIQKIQKDFEQSDISNISNSSIDHLRRVYQPKSVQKNEVTSPNTKQNQNFSYEEKSQRKPPINLNRDPSEQPIKSKTDNKLKCDSILPVHISKLLNKIQQYYKNYQKQWNEFLNTLDKIERKKLVIEIQNFYQNFPSIEISGPFIGIYMVNKETYKQLIDSQKQWEFEENIIQIKRIGKEFIHSQQRNFALFLLLKFIFGVEVLPVVAMRTLELDIEKNNKPKRTFYQLAYGFNLKKTKIYKLDDFQQTESGVSYEQKNQMGEVIKKVKINPLSFLKQLIAAIFATPIENYIPNYVVLENGDIVRNFIDISNEDRAQFSGIKNPLFFFKNYLQQLNAKEFDLLNNLMQRDYLYLFFSSLKFISYAEVTDFQLEIKDGRLVNSLLISKGQINGIFDLLRQFYSVFIWLEEVVLPISENIGIYQIIQKLWPIITEFSERITSDNIKDHNSFMKKIAIEEFLQRNIKKKNLKKYLDAIRCFDEIADKTQQQFTSEKSDSFKLQKLDEILSTKNQICQWLINIDLNELSTVQNRSIILKFVSENFFFQEYFDTSFLKTIHQSFFDKSLWKEVLEFIKHNNKNKGSIFIELLGLVLNVGVENIQGHQLFSFLEIYDENQLTTNLNGFDNWNLYLSCEKIKGDKGYPSRLTLLERALEYRKYKVCLKLLDLGEGQNIQSDTLTKFFILEAKKTGQNSYILGMQRQILEKLRKLHQALVSSFEWERIWLQILPSNDAKLQKSHIKFQVEDSELEGTSDNKLNKYVSTKSNIPLSQNNSKNIPNLNSKSQIINQEQLNNSQQLKNMDIKLYTREFGVKLLSKDIVEQIYHYINNEAAEQNQLQVEKKIVEEIQQNQNENNSQQDSQVNSDVESVKKQTENQNNNSKLKDELNSPLHKIQLLFKLIKLENDYDQYLSDEDQNINENSIHLQTQEDQEETHKNIKKPMFQVLGRINNTEHMFQQYIKDGVTLAQAFNYVNFPIENILEKKSLGERILVSMLMYESYVPPEDEVLEIHPENSDLLRLVNIGDSRCFVKNIIKKQDKCYINVKNVLFCMDQMKEVIEEDLVEKFSNFVGEDKCPEQIIRHLIYNLVEYQKDLIQRKILDPKIFKEQYQYFEVIENNINIEESYNVQKENDSDNQKFLEWGYILDPNYTKTFLGIPLQKFQFKELLDRFKKMIQAFQFKKKAKELNKFRYIDLFKIIDPVLAKYYEIVLENPNIPIPYRFKLICKSIPNFQGVGDGNQPTFDEHFMLKNSIREEENEFDEIVENFQHYGTTQILQKFKKYRKIYPKNSLEQDRNLKRTLYNLTSKKELNTFLNALEFNYAPEAQQNQFLEDFQMWQKYFQSNYGEEISQITLQNLPVLNFKKLHTNINLERITCLTLINCPNINDADISFSEPFNLDSHIQELCAFLASIYSTHSDLKVQLKGFQNKLNLDYIKQQTQQLEDNLNQQIENTVAHENQQQQQIQNIKKDSEEEKKQEQQDSTQIQQQALQQQKEKRKTSQKESFKYIQDLVKAICDNKHISYLDLSRTYLSKETFRDLFENIKFASSIILNECNINDDLLKLISSSLGTRKSIKLLDLSKNQITKDGVNELADQLINNRYLQILKLDENDLKGTLFDKFINIQTLSLQKTQLKLEDFEKINQMFDLDTKLELLDLSNNQIDILGLDLIVQGILKRNNLKELKMKNIIQKGVQQNEKEKFLNIIKNLICNSKSLQSLNISANDISDEGLKLVADGLIENKKLKILVIKKDYSFTQNGLHFIVQALKKNQSLSFFDFDIEGEKQNEQKAQSNPLCSNFPFQFKAQIQPYADISQNYNIQNQQINYIKDQQNQSQNDTDISFENSFFLKENVKNLNQNDMEDLIIKKKIAFKTKQEIQNLLKKNTKNFKNQLNQLQQSQIQYQIDEEQILNKNNRYDKFDYFKVGLSIDGGGMRGIIPGVMLEYLAKETKQEPFQMFDCVGGTSIGGIIALGVTGTLDGRNPIVPSTGITNFFETHGADIFNKSKIVQIWNNLMDRSKYDPIGLQECLNNYFQNAKLSDILPGTNVLVTSVKREINRIQGKNSAKIFRSRQAVFDQNKNFYMRDVGRATSAAPTFFPSAEIQNISGSKSYSLIDGGIGQNNPAKFVLDDIKKEALNSGNENNFFLVSLGTGILKVTSSIDKNSGLLNILPLIEGIQESGIHYVEKDIEKNYSGHYVRAQPLVPLDKSKADLDSIEPSILQQYKECALDIAIESFTQKEIYGQYFDRSLVDWLAENTARKRDFFV
ncbi:Acyl transferase/acyl hydrolase/lysophospholipase [Pseudocohnilembus persalinus]|uniref:Acyl transferase/acyl hydrolase/lysophospholipase n=1 Tax=Pseudocohnilembus persalinus TaxID=266149 RepID=A0A0V0QJU6_PSEPJ|nr:Acyl transferase/acyl hydrolase/lysophospholipase [Pseudocohnilembus persalinus]|eukprot:KRX02408.1 Acyl transferase/acyl hydrolase/lysophospholipase [Pseudocohnilembus persalinus]